MTTNIERNIPALAPRHGSAARLLGKNRVENSVLAPVPETTRIVGTRKMTTDIPIDILDRAKSAFRRHGASHDVRTFSEWVSRAMNAELIRWENEFNEGKQLPPERDPLTPGRKIA